MDQFVQNTETSTPAPASRPVRRSPAWSWTTTTATPSPALWNYAQNYAMSDNSFDTTFGPSTPGRAQPGLRPDRTASYAVDPMTGAPVADPARRQLAGRARRRHGHRRPRPGLRRLLRQQPHVHATTLAVLTGKNIGDLLNAQERHAGAGSRAASSRPATNAAGLRGLRRAHTQHRRQLGRRLQPAPQAVRVLQVDGQPASTCRRRSVAAIGHTDQANHQYDLSDFDAALKASNLPAVSFLKAAEYQDGHAGYSDPLDEQHFLVNTINQIAEVQVLERHRDRRSPTTTPTAGTTTRRR